MRDRTLVPKLSGLAADSFHALEDFFDRREMLLLILLGNPIGHRQHLDPLVFGEPVDVLVDKRLQPTARGHLKEDGGHFVGRLAGDALVGFLRFPRVGDIYRNCWVVLGDVHGARMGKAGE